jgi:hypothetical protein
MELQETATGLLETDLDLKSPRWLVTMADSMIATAKTLCARLEKSEYGQQRRHANEVRKWIALLEDASETIASIGEYVNDARSLLVDILLPASRNLELDNGIYTWS